MKDFENIGKLIEDGQITKNGLLSAVLNGDIHLAVYADGFFVWPAIKLLNNQYDVKGPHRLCENEFLYVASKYYRRFDANGPVAMGFACSKPTPDADRLIRLEGNVRSKKKPCLPLTALYIADADLKRHLVTNTPELLRRAEGIEAAKSLLRQKFEQGKLRNEDDFQNWMKNAHVIRHIRANKGQFPHCAKITPRSDKGNTADKEPTLTKSFVGIFKDVSVLEEYRSLIASQ